MKKRYSYIPLLVLSSITLTSCNLDVTPKDALTVAINYDGTNTRITYQNDTDYETPNGTKISKGDFKPVWRQVQNDLGIHLTEYEDAVSSGKAVNYFNLNWQTKQYADIACANVTDINNFSVAGSNETILDLKQYIDSGQMPNFKTFLDENPTVKMSIITAKHSKANQGAIYYLPYFDGIDDLERMPMLRADFVKKLLDTETTFYPEDTFKSEAAYQPFDVKEDLETAPEYEITVPLKNGSDTKTLTKKSTTNIIKRQNDLIKNGNVTSEKLVTDFKDYFNKRYGSPGNDNDFFTNYSDLFLGYSTCYDADELVALLRIIKASPRTLLEDENTTKEMVPFLPRQWDNQRSADIYRWAGQLFGVRGVESRLGYLYINGKNEDGAIVHDCRGDEATRQMLINLQNMYKEKLILQNFDTKTAAINSDGKFAQDLMVNNGNDSYCGFMEFDYAQTQGVWNDKSTKIKDHDLRPIIGPVAKWDTDGNGDKDEYFQFTESWRSVKTQGLVLRAGLAKDETKLNNALRLVDYFYSKEGQELNSFGPATEGYTDGTMEYLKRTIPKFSIIALKQLADKNIGGGSYTNYLRKFVGATLPIGYVKEQGMEYQCTNAQTQAGLDIINKAINLGTLKHPFLNYSENEKPFFRIVPSAFFLTKGQASSISELSDKTKLGSIFSESSTSSFNIWDSYVMGKVAPDAPTLDNYIDTVNKTWKLEKYVAYYQDAYEAMGG